MYVAFAYTQNACGIINSYYSVSMVDTCSNIMVVSSKGLQKGDRVVIMQMNGADALLNNNNAFGNLTAINGAGNYEFNVVNDVVADTQLTFSLRFLNTYNASKALQIIQFPAYRSVNVTCPLSCLPWNGRTGGVLVLFATDTIRVQAKIDISGKGFRGSYPLNAGNCLPLPYSDYYTTAASNLAARKGEGLFLLSAANECGRGKAVNAGGGGNEHNSGGGGGGNYGKGGDGGERIKNVLSCPGNYPGIGGEALSVFYNGLQKNKLFMGGSGGCGHENNNYSDTSGSGGGIAFVIARIVKCNGDTIASNGENVKDYCVEDGGSGGGAGGVIVFKVDSVYGKVCLSVNGGSGQSVDNSAKNECYGPGGGGGGGVALISAKTKVNNVLFDTLGGKSGLVYNSIGTCNNTSNNASNGFPGRTFINYVYNENPIIFRKFTVSAGADITICRGDSVHLNASVGKSFLWSPNYKLNNPNIKSPSGAPDSTITYIVKAFDSCSFAFDTVTITVLQLPNLSHTRDTILCYGDTLQLFALGGSNYKWSPPVSIDNITTANPRVWPSTDAKYIISASNGSCIISDTIRIKVVQSPIVTSSHDTTLCIGDKLILYAMGASKYAWSPNIGINDTSISNPEITATRSMIYFVKGSNSAGCYAINKVTITVDSCKKPVKELTQVIIPNVFTPNKDGVNDVFEIVAKNVREFSVTVFNRWGQSVFTSQDSSFKWDGANAMDGIYYYKINYTDLDMQSFENKGAVTLIR